MSHTRTINPDSLELISGNVIMSQPRSYPYPKELLLTFGDNSNVFSLLGYHDVQKLLHDNDLNIDRYEFDDKLSVIDTNDDDDPNIRQMIERDTGIAYPIIKLIKERKLRMSDTNNVLFYLITVRPLEGMCYGAKHGIERLFFAAKSRYFYKHYNDVSDFLKFQDSLLYEVMPFSIKAGSVSIFKDCVKYLPSDRVDYDEALRIAAAAVHNRTEMVKCIFTEGGHVLTVYNSGVLPIASRYGDADLMKLLIHKLRSETNDYVFEEQVFESAKITILNDRLEAFMFLLPYCASNRIESLFTLCVKANKVEVFDVLVELHKDLLHDDNGRLLKKTIKLTYNIMVYKLLKSFHYTEQTLIGILMNTVQKEAIISSPLHERVLDSLLRRINPQSIDREHVLSITKDESVKVYLQERWYYHQVL